MESKFTLQIKDPALRVEYYEKRNKEILPLSVILAVLIILINIISAIVSVRDKWGE